MTLYPQITSYLNSLSTEEISDDRKKVLNPLRNFIIEKRNIGLPIYLNFICTHNSRRSHLSQIWAQTIAAYCQIENVYCYSGGTEATTIYHVVLQTLKNIGFQNEALSKENNPVFAIKFGNNFAPVIAFSKKYDDPFNPESDFAAILTCSQADEGCPFIVGAEKRISVTYEDPKAFDNTSVQLNKYQERSEQIATEILYVFSNL